LFKIIFDGDYEQYIFARWSDYLERLEEDDERLDVFEFADRYNEQILLFYRLSKVNQKKAEDDFQEWLSNLLRRTLH